MQGGAALSLIVVKALSSRRCSEKMEDGKKLDFAHGKLFYLSFYCLLGYFSHLVFLLCIFMESSAYMMINIFQRVVDKS